MNELQRAEFLRASSNDVNGSYIYADAHCEYGSARHSYITYKAMGIDEATKKVIEAFPKVPLDASHDEAFDILQKPIQDLIDSGKAYLSYQQAQRREGNNVDWRDVENAENVLNGYRAAQNLLLNALSFSG